MTPPSDNNGALVWDQPARPSPPRRPTSPVPGATEQESDPEPAPATEPVTDRIPLREASDRYGVSVGTLRNWCRSGQVDGLLVESPSGRRWMVKPATVAERVATGRRPAQDSPPAEPAAEPGAMLVPRAAWDKLMDQLGNLHESGQHLAEARERAARYETEAVFLRERLAEMREERDELRSRVDTPSETQTLSTESAPAPRPGIGEMIRDLRQRFGRGATRR